MLAFLTASPMRYLFLLAKDPISPLDRRPRRLEGGQEGVCGGEGKGKGGWEGGCVGGEGGGGE